MNALRRAWRWWKAFNRALAAAYFPAANYDLFIKHYTQREGVEAFYPGVGRIDNSADGPYADFVITSWTYPDGITISVGPFTPPIERHQWMGWEEAS